MNIRSRITLNFFGIVIIVVSVISASIYYFSSQYREHDFYRRLKSRASNTARLLTEFEEVDVALLQRMERENPSSLPKQHVTIFNYKNEILYRGNDDPPIPIDPTLLNRIRLEKEVRFRYNEFEVLGFLFTDKFDRFAVVAAATDINGMDALDNLRNVLIIVFLLSLLIVSGLGWVFAGRVVRPISKIVGEVDAITEKNLDLRVGEGNRHDELGKLAATFNKMIARLQAAFSSQKNFIANASHEIKTPITAMTTELEVTLMQKRSTEYYEGVLRSVLAGARGMNKLSTQLLLLAQASSEISEKNFSGVRVDDVMWAVKTELSQINPTFNINIEFAESINDESLVVSGDSGLLKVVFHNLIENGCKYSSNNTVYVSLSKDDTNLLITFSNDGQGIPKEDQVRIFEPFYRGKGSKRVRGFGIGLPLTKKIVDLHGGTLSLDSELGVRTSFHLKLPISKNSNE
jgi:signal transduction histidine kinase